ncbi:MAG: threonine synthase [Rhodospirillales bacterium]|nr:threonine synthase [Rhodospirillales bacterium]
MRYVSTRGTAPALSFDDVVLAGLAQDGGLYVPETWPTLSRDALQGMRRLSYPERAARVLALFAQPSLSEDELAMLSEDAYRAFDGYPDVAPLKQIGADEWLLELFHGPTLAFKDFALQVLGRLFDLVLSRRGERITIVGATSGDTGSAAIEACRDRDSLDIFILHPKDRVSDVQRRQMTTVESPNVHNIAIEGTFDDCQDLVKALFNDAEFRRRHRLAAVNSINWARIAAQIVYYVHAVLDLNAGEHPVAFAVPTGNFGNVFAAYSAARMGLPIEQLIIGSNRNDILPRFFATGRMEIGDVFPTLSPSMDIQISSNFERFLFEVLDRNGASVVERMDSLRAQRGFEVDAAQFARACSSFVAARFDDAQTKETMRVLFEETGELLDPHTAIGVAAGRSWRRPDGVPLVSVATAHPAKFPDAVQAATGVRPTLPKRLADLMRRDEHYSVLPADVDALRQTIAAKATTKGATA